MTVDWLSNAAVSIITSIVAAALALWRATLQLAGQQSVMEAKFSAMREEFSRAQKANDEIRSETARDLKDATKSLYEVITQMKVMATEYGTAMKVVTSTLESITKKLEYLEMTNAEHDKEIALLQQAEKIDK